LPEEFRFERDVDVFAGQDAAGLERGLMIGE
jgi:hypothetical protein